MMTTTTTTTTCTTISLSEYVRLNPNAISASLDKLTAVGRHISEIDINEAFLVTVLDQCKQSNKVNLSSTLIEDMCNLLSYNSKVALHSKAYSNVSFTSSSSSITECHSRHHEERRKKSCGLNIALAQKLETVLLSRNKLSTIIGVVQFRHVVRLSLLGNHIRRIDDCEVLSLLPQLQFLSLEYNPVTSLLHYRAHLLRICSWPYNVDVHTCRLRKLDAIRVDAEEIKHAQYCLEREYILLPELMHRHQFLCFLVHLETKLKIHAEMAKRGLLVVDHLRERKVTDLLNRCAAAALHTCHTTALTHATRLWVSQQEGVNCNVDAQHNTSHQVIHRDKSMNNDVREQPPEAHANNKFTSASKKATVKPLLHQSTYKAHKYRRAKQFYEASDSSHSSSEREEDRESARCSDEVEVPHNYFTKECSTSSKNNCEEKLSSSSLNVSNISLSSDDSSVSSLLNWSRISLHNAHRVLDHDLCTEWSNSAFRHALTLLDVSVCNCLLRVARCCHATLSSQDLDRLSLEWLHLSATHSHLTRYNLTHQDVRSGKKENNNNTNTTKKKVINEVKMEMSNNNCVETEREEQPHLFHEQETEKETVQNNDTLKNDVNGRCHDNQITSHLSSLTSLEHYSFEEQKKESAPTLRSAARRVIGSEMNIDKSPQSQIDEELATVTVELHNDATMMSTSLRDTPMQQERAILISPTGMIKTEVLQSKMSKIVDELKCEREAHFMHHARERTIRRVLRQWQKKLRKVNLCKMSIQFVKLQQERRCQAQCNYVHFTLPVHAQLLLLPYTERKRTFFNYWRSRLCENWLIRRIKLCRVLHKWHHKKCDAQRSKQLELHLHEQMKRSAFYRWHENVRKRRDQAKVLFCSTLSAKNDKKEKSSARMFSLSPPPKFPGVQLLTPSYNTNSESAETLHSTVQLKMNCGHDVNVQVNNEKSKSQTDGCYLNHVLRNVKDDNGGLKNSAVRIVWNSKNKESSEHMSNVQEEEQLEYHHSHRSPLYKSPFVFGLRSINKHHEQTKELEHLLEEKNIIEKNLNKDYMEANENKNNIDNQVSNSANLQMLQNKRKSNSDDNNCSNTPIRDAINRMKLEKKSLISECTNEELKKELKFSEEEEEQELKQKEQESNYWQEKETQIKEDAISNEEESNESMFISLALASTNLYNDLEHLPTSNITREKVHCSATEDVVIKRLQALTCEYDTLRSRFVDQQIQLEEAQLRRKEAFVELERMHSLLIERESEAEQVRMSGTFHSQKIAYLQESLHALEERHRKMM